MRRAILLLLYIIGALTLQAQNPSPKYEARAVWLTTIGGLDWPHNYAQSSRSMERQQQELCDILDRLQRAGINQVLLQTRIRATTIYPSAYEPWDGCLSGFPGTSPGYDALQFAIEQCHRRGMELHAWVVVMPVGKWNALGCRRLRRRHPSLVRHIGDEGYLNPERTQTADYVADICEEIVRNYDVDGIHLDYIRYPEKWKIRVSGDQGRRNITRIVRAVHDRVKALKPYVKMSCSPIGKFDDLSRYWSHGWNAYKRVCQDAQGWLREGLMDELFPMMYFEGEQFYPFAIDWSENSAGRIVAPGLGIYLMSPSEKNWPLETITREMEVLRAYGLGHTYFRSKFFTDDLKGIYRFANDRFDAAPALVPPMTWEHATRPVRPYGLNLKAGRLSWSSSDSTLSFNVYSSRQWPVDISDGRNLVRIRLHDTSVQVPADGTPRYYAVTSTDRYGNESEALQMPAPPKESFHPATPLLSCDGRKLRLPDRDAQSDADMLLIEDLKGRQVALWPYKDEVVDVSRLEEGFYQLRTLNARGITHRIGFFCVKRY